VGVTGTSSDAAYFIADAKGFFRDEGIRVQFIRFDSAAKMIAPLGSGDLDVGGGATSVALYNAAKRDVRIKIVAEKGRMPKNGSWEAVVVRKDLFDSGRVKSLGDLKGLRVSVNSTGNSEAVLLDEALNRGKLTWKDIEPVYLGFSQHPPAFLNGALDAAITAEPFLTSMLKAGTIVKLIGVDEYYPDFQNAVTLYGSAFIEKRPAEAQKFMNAMLRGLRYYHDALQGGKLAGKNADDVIRILTEYATLKNPAVYREVNSHAVDPDGGVNLESLNRAWEFFRKTSQIDGSISLADVTDLSFVRKAVEQLGAYKAPAQ
jgi:NitT/TauT family transport system substrate-binding protein